MEDEGSVEQDPTAEAGEDTGEAGEDTGEAPEDSVEDSGPAVEDSGPPVEDNGPPVEDSGPAAANADEDGGQPVEGAAEDGGETVKVEGRDRETVRLKREYEAEVESKVASDYSHIVWAYGIIWALFVIYGAILWRRASAQAEDLEALRKRDK